MIEKALFYRLKNIFRFGTVSALYTDIEREGDKMMNGEKILKCVQKVFGDESYRVRVMQSGNIFKVEVRDMIHDGIWIRSEDTMEEKIDELFYDYCMNNIDWMGVS